MEKFDYIATDKKNNKVKGQVEALNQAQAQSMLRERGLFIINMEKIEVMPAWMKMFNIFNKIKKQDVVHFTRQLATMIKAGLPLTTSLSILKYQSNLSMAKVVDEVLRDVEGGGSFYKALNKHKKVFSPVYLSLIRSGEAAGVIEKVLLRLADNLEKESAFRSKTKNALIYPAIVTTAMIIVAAVMMIFVIPKLTSLYDEFGAELPGMTKVLIGMSNFMVKTWYAQLLILIVGGYSFLEWKKTLFGKTFLDAKILKFPVQIQNPYI